MTARHRVAAGALASIMVAGCLPAVVTPEGRDIATLYVGFMVVATVFVLAVIVPTTIAILRFRGRRGDELPAQRRGHLGIEILWTAIPAVTVVGLFIATLLVLARVEATDAPGATEIRVTAFRWGWTFEYPQNGVAVSGIGTLGPEVAVPVDEPITLTMNSVDVVHSFYVPVFLFKRDVVPGRETTFQFTVEEAGRYGGQCAEYCGVFHARMPFAVVAMPRAEFDAWLAGAPRASASPSPATP